MPYNLRTPGQGVSEHTEHQQNWLDRWIPDDVLAERNIHLDRARMTVAIAILLGPTNALLVAVRVARGLPFSSILPPLVAGLIALAVPQIMSRSSSPKLAANLLLGVLFLATSFSNLRYGGLLPAAQIGALVLPMIAVMMVGARNGAIWVLPSILLLLAAPRIAEIPADLAISPTLSASAFGLGAAMLFGLTAVYDMTKERVIAEAQQARRRAVEASEARSKFLAAVSHDLRTPMNGILGSTELLLDTDLPVDSAELARVVQSSAHNLLTLLDDLIDLSRLEYSDVQMAARPFDISDCVRTVCRNLESRARAGDLGLTLDVSPAVSWVIGDEARLQQVVGNLLSNAIRYTIEGEIRVSVNSELVGEMTRVQIRVQDPGIGIPEDELPFLFERFVRGRLANERDSHGLGLGLAITQQLVERMDGQIDVESAVGVGTTFCVTLDLTPTKHVPAIARSTAQFDARILVVDDEVVNRLVVSKMLASLGCTVQEAVDGIDGVEAAVAGEHELILMDLEMPGLDGVAATRQILATMRSPPPIIALTANVMPEERERCIAVGMKGFLTKPVSIAKLRAELGRHLRTDG